MRYFEDFHVGDAFDFGSYRVTEEEIIAFARQYDPQAIHLDPERAKDSNFEGLIASGWHSTGIWMRLLVDGLIKETASMGSPGVKEIRWLKPVRPGDDLRVHFMITECTPSKSRRNMGILQSKSELINQLHETVMSIVGTHFIGHRS
jgi:acyl dehydratase